MFAPISNTLHHLPQSDYLRDFEPHMLVKIFDYKAANDKLKSIL